VIDLEMTMSEMAQAMRMLQGGFSTALRQINYPMHKGQPNPAHGKFHFVGTIPANCWDETRNGGRGGAVCFDTEDEAIAAAIAGGATRIQRCDCSFVDIDAWIEAKCDEARAEEIEHEAALELWAERGGYAAGLAKPGARSA
jgi:hypothetical protein